VFLQVLPVDFAEREPTLRFQSKYQEMKLWSERAQQAELEWVRGQERAVGTSSI
jgi:hypothetical protein